MGKSLYTKARRQLTTKLVRAREDAGFTQKQVQDLLGITQSELSKIENGQRKVEALVLDAFARLYKKPVTFFLVDSFPKEFPDPRNPLIAQDPGSDYLYAAKFENNNEVADRQILMRRGNQEFRNALIKRYGAICMVTGCKVLALVEAAQINWGLDEGYKVTNGLLLRADIHTLFDLDLVGIEPNSLEIHIKPSVKDSEYRNLQGCKLHGCDSQKRPNTAALQSRWDTFNNFD